MKIAVAHENGTVFAHFGHTAQFKLYDVENGRIISTRVVDTEGSGHGLLAGFLNGLGVDALICGGIGAGARNALAEAGIRVFGGVAGDADEAAQALAAGKLTFDPHAACAHHGAHHGDACADHGCGAHACSGHDENER